MKGRTKPHSSDSVSIADEFESMAVESITSHMYTGEVGYALIRVTLMHMRMPRRSLFERSGHVLLVCGAGTGNEIRKNTSFGGRGRRHINRDQDGKERTRDRVWWIQSRVCW